MNTTVHISDYQLMKNAGKWDLVLITPEKAGEMLGNNRESNRNIKSSHVRKLVNIMNKDEFKLTHQGIGVLSDGTLVDGQHRLSAILQTGKPIPCWVYYYPEGYDPYSVLDQGAVRTIADIHSLSMHGAAFCRATAQFIFKPKHYRTSRAYQPTQGEIKETIKCFYRFYERLHSFYPGNRAVTTTALSQVCATAQAINTKTDYPFEIYRLLNKGSIADMPPVAIAFKDQLFNGTVKLNSEPHYADALVRFMILYNPANRDHTTIRVNEKRIEEYRNQVVNILSDYYLECGDEA